MSSRLILFVFVLSAVGLTLASLYPKNSNVVNLNNVSFQKEVLKSSQLWLVEFYAPWCGHCKNLAPEWEKSATNLKGLVKVGAVNCDEDANKALAGTYQIQGFPTIKVFKDGKFLEDYRGARDAAAIVRYALSKQPSLVQVATASTFDSIIEKNQKLPALVLFTEKSETTSLYKGLSTSFAKKVLFLQVNNKQQELVSRFGVTKFPTLILLNPNGGDPITFNGKLSVDSISSFLQTSTGLFGGADAGAEPEAEKPIVAKLNHVVSQDEWNRSCGASKVVCVVGFLDKEASADEYSQHLKYFDALVAKFGSRLSYVVVDGPTQTKLAEFFDLRSGFPAVAYYSPNRKSAAKYVGPFDEEHLLASVENLLIGKVRLFPVKGDVPAIAKPHSEKDL